MISRAFSPSLRSFTLTEASARSAASLVRKNFRCRFPLRRGRPSIAQCCSGRVSSFGIRTRCATSGFICATMHTRVAYCQFGVNEPRCRLTRTPARMRSRKGLAFDLRVAESTGLEPATSAVTGQRSNQLSYDSNLRNAKLEPNAIPFNKKMIWGSAGSWAAQSCIRNSTAFSICGSFPSPVLLASLSTLMSGST